jgi:hypothetical protein
MRVVFVCVQLQMPESKREKIFASSAFRSFEVQSCQLQMVDVIQLDDNSKTVFFSNIFNVMTGNRIMYPLLAVGYI